MFTTPEKVLELTGYEVDAQRVAMAQSIVEVYIGRTEADISNPGDLALLEKAVAYQAAYMKDNWTRTFEQAAVAQVMQNSNMVTFRVGDYASPWLAPLSRLACKNLTFKKSRSLKTGRIFSRHTISWYQD